MKFNIVISSSCIVLLVLVIIVLFTTIRDKFNTKFNTNYLITNNYCRVINDKGIQIVTNDGSLFGYGGKYSKEYCVLNPLILTDEKFKEKALALIDLDNIYTFITNIFNDKQKLPDQNLINTYPVLSSMIINPWYSSDDVYYTPQDIYYTYNLSTFKINNKIFNGLSNNGLYLSWYDSVTSINFNTGKECSVFEKIECESPLKYKCQCQQDTVRQYYLYMDNKLILDLPTQLYLGKLSDSDLLQIKLSKSLADVIPLRINTLTELETLLEKYFYNFREKAGNICELLSDDDQKEQDSFCKFFTSSSLSGIVVILRRLIINNIPSNVTMEFIQKIDNKISINKKLDYLEFFLWLAATSKVNKVSYNFILYKN